MVLAIAIAIIFAQDSQRGRLHKKLDRAEWMYLNLLNAPADTIVKRDTVTITEFKEVVRYRTREVVSVPDTLVVYDTVLQVYQMPRESVTYKAEDFKAIISGVEPRLDSMAVYPKKVEITKIVREIERKKTRWGIGLQAGYGYNGRELHPYIGVGVSYNIFAW